MMNVKSQSSLFPHLSVGLWCSICFLQFKKENLLTSTIIEKLQQSLFLLSFVHSVSIPLNEFCCDDDDIKATDIGLLIFQMNIVYELSIETNHHHSFVYLSICRHTLYSSLYMKELYQSFLSNTPNANQTISTVNLYK